MRQDTLVALYLIGKAQGAAAVAKHAASAPSYGLDPVDEANRMADIFGQAQPAELTADQRRSIIELANDIEGKV